MISFLKGKLVAKHPPTIIIETGSIGYQVDASMQTFYQLPELDNDILLYICLLIREEKPVLYGFTRAEERNLFQELIKINTIGPKVALAILSSIDANQLLHIVSEKNVQALNHIPGIGRKTAERLLLELTNRLSAWKPIIETAVQSKTATLSQHTHLLIQQDALTALIALGYKPHVAQQSINGILQDEKDATTLSLEQLIRLALQHLRQ